MRPNARALALRDPALAALTGALTGADFGADFGSDFGDDYGDDMGYSFGYGFGVDPPPPPPPPAAHPAHAHHMHHQHHAAQPLAVHPSQPGAPHPAAAAALWHKHQQKMAHTSRRKSLIEPNEGSDVKIERYAFSINQAIVLGTTIAVSASGQPDTSIRPQRVSMNAPAPGFVTLNEIKVANVSVTVGGIGDAWDYNANGVGQSLDMPTLSPANRASLLGNYTGYVPPGFVGGSAYTFCCTFKGPSSIVA